MTTVFEFLRSDVAADLSIALLHTLWQGLVITLILYLALKSIPGNLSQRRYRLSIISMLLVMLCWLGTFSILRYEPDVGVENRAVTSKAILSTDVPAVTNNAETATVIKTDHLPSNNTTDSRARSLGFGWFIILWSVGVIAMLGRMFAALAGTVRLKRDAVDITDNALVELFENLCARMNIKQKIRFAASRTLRHPGVIGFWRPVLLVPVSILNEVSVEYLQAIIAHELAHIRRYDYLINFCQMLIEAIFFFNPAVWWISRRIRIEREACCDIAGIESIGRRIGYAQVLLDELSRTAARGLPAMSAAITGFSDDNESSSTERVKRIIYPQHKPSMKIGWFKLMLLLAAAGGALLGLWKTADITIAMAAKIMTPQQRIEKIEEIAETHDSEYNEYNENEKVTLSGKVTTYDGMPLPRHPQTVIHSYGSKTSSNIYISVESSGKFEQTIRCRENVFVSVKVPGYAPGFSETYHPEPNDIIDDINIVLNEGFTGKVRVVDEQGRPIADASLSKDYFIKIQNGWGGLGSVNKAVADEDGIALFEHCLEKPVKITVEADGYQKIDNSDYTLRENETTVISLKKGLIASGIVVAKETGEPIADAKFRLYHKERLGYGWSYGAGQDYEMATDASGKFELNTLAEGYKYDYVVEAQGYNRFVLPKIEPGDKDIKAEMIPELHIKGKVIGDLSKLGKSYVSELRESVPALRFASRFTNDEYGDVYEDDSVPVDIIDGVGYFTLNDILGNEVTFRAIGAEKRMTISLDGKSVEDVVIDLDAVNVQMNVPTRPMVLTFQSPPGYPPVEGKAKISYMTEEVNESDHRQWSGLDLVVENGVGKIDFPVPAYMRLAETRDLKGFWFEPDPWEADKLVIAGDEPYERTIIAEPAGNIYGQILDGDGKLIKHAEMNLLLVKRPEKYNSYKNFHQIKRKMKEGLDSHVIETGKFHSAGLPLGGTYAVVARDGYTWMISKPIELIEEKPIQEVTLRLNKPKRISGRLLLPDKSPAKDMEISLQVLALYSDEDSYGLSSAKNTDSNGAFVFENINPQEPLKYTLRIKPAPGYQPIGVEVKPGTDKTYVLKKGFTFKGRILDNETGWPIPGAWVYAESVDDENQLTRHRTSDRMTDRHGNFAFTSLNNERYKLYTGAADIVKPGYRQRIITGGKDKNLDLRVELRSWSRLKPRKPDDGE